MRPTGALAGLLAVHLPLLLWPLQCLANVPPLKPTGGNRTSDEPELDFDSQGVPVNLHPTSGHRLNESWFQPSLSMDMHFVTLRDDRAPELLQITLEHDEHPYVNLEAIEPFLNKPVICRMARLGERTNLDLHFQDSEGFEMAERYWSGNASIRFVVEGIHCFEAAGVRSMYHSTGILFHAERNLVIIRADPMHAQLHWESDWAHEVTMQKHYVPEGHRLVARQSLEVSHDGNDLRRRGLDLHLDGLDFNMDKKLEFDLGERYNFWERSDWFDGQTYVKLTCINCHARGAWKLGFHVRFSLSPNNNRDGCEEATPRASSRKRSAKSTEFFEEYGSLLPYVYMYMEADRIERHRSNEFKLRKLRKRGVIHHPVLGDSTCTEDDPTYPVCHERQIPRAVEEASDDIDKCNILLHPLLAVKKGIKCFWKSILYSHDEETEECQAEIRDDVVEVVENGVKEYFEAFMLAHLSQAEVSLEVTEEVDVQWQLEIGSQVGLSFWFDVEFVPMVLAVIPAPPFVVPIPDPKMISLSLGYFVGVGGGKLGQSLSALPSTEKGKTIGNKMSPANQRLGKNLDGKHEKWANKAKETMENEVDRAQKSSGEKTTKFTTGMVDKLPGLYFAPLMIDLSISFGGAVNLTLPGFHFRMSPGTFTFSPLKAEGDRLHSTIKVVTEYLNAGLELKDPSLSITMSAGPYWKIDFMPYPPGAREAGAKSPLTIGGHFQPIRFDHNFGLAGPNDPDHCSENEVKYEALFRTGMSAWVQSLFFRPIDTSWIAPLQKSDIASENIRGLWWSKRLHVECLGMFVDADGANSKLNQLLAKLQEPLKQQVAKIGEFLTGVANKGIEADHSAHGYDKAEGNMTFSDYREFGQWYTSVGPGRPREGRCRNEGMCDPYSSFYIPNGAEEFNQQIYDYDALEHGLKSAFNKEEFNPVSIFSEAMFSTSHTPIPMVSSTSWDGPQPANNLVPDWFLSQFSTTSSTWTTTASSSLADSATEPMSGSESTSEPAQTRSPEKRRNRSDVISGVVTAASATTTQRSVAGARREAGSEYWKITSRMPGRG